MKRLLAIWAGGLLMAAVAFGGLCLANPRASAGGIRTCPEGDTCITGKLVVRDPGSDTGNQFISEDKNGAAMFWVNMFGAQSGGEPVCVVGLRLQPLACIGGPHGSYGGEPVVTLYGRGGPVTLTPRDIRFLHRLERGLR